MKRTTRKLFVAAAALGLAAASTIGSTYAWFTINGSANVSSLDMTVTSGAGISVREHATAETNFTTDLTLAQAALTDATAITPTAFNDVSAWKIVDVEGTIAKQTASEVTAYDYELDDLSDDEKAKSLFESTLDVKVSKGYDVKAYFTFTAGSDTQAARVMRIAFTYGTTTTTYRLVAQAQTSDVATEAFRKTYSLANLNNNLTDSTNSTTACTVLGSTKDGATTLITSSTSGNGYDEYEQVKIDVWYEGKDVECSNDIFAQQVAFDLTLIPVKHA